MGGLARPAPGRVRGADAGRGSLVKLWGSGWGYSMPAVSDEDGGCGRVCDGVYLAAGESVRGAVGGGDVGAARGEDAQLGVGHAGRPARDAVVLQDEPVMPGEHGANSEYRERVLQFGQQEHPAVGLGTAEDRHAVRCRGGVGRVRHLRLDLRSFRIA